MIEFLTVVSSIGMLVITIIYVIYTRSIFIANKKMNEHTELIRKEDMKPFVIGYFDLINSNLVYFHVENIGKTPAINTDVRIEKLSGKISDNYFLSSNLINTTIHTLAPQQKISTLVDIFFDMKDENDKYPTFKVVSKYESMDQTSYTDTYYFDLNIYKGKSDVSNKGIKDIYNEIKRLRIIEDNRYKLESKLALIQKENIK